MTIYFSETVVQRKRGAHMKERPDNQLSPQELLERDQKLLEVLCIDYYYCNLAKNTMEPIKRSALSNGSVIDAAIPERRYEYTYRIQYFYDNFVVKASAPDFLEKLSIPFLWAHLQTKERLAYRLCTIPNPAGQEYFERRSYGSMLTGMVLKLCWDSGTFRTAARPSTIRSRP